MLLEMKFYANWNINLLRIVFNSIDKNHNNEDKKWNRSLSFLRRGSSRRKKGDNDGHAYTQVLILFLICRFAFFPLA